MFLVCGEALYDVFTGRADGARVGLNAVIGGSPLNVAIGLARQGQDVGLLAGISTDPLGDGLATHIAREGVRTEYLRRKANPTTLSLVGIGPGGAPHYTFYGHNAADISLTIEDLPVFSPDIAGIHVGSYTLVCSPMADTLAALVRRENHRLITLDPNIRPTVEPDMAVWRARIAALLPHVSVVKASDEDLALLYPEAGDERTARAWLAAGPAAVIVTRGAEGATAFTRSWRIDVPAPAVAVVDTVGAGDTFQATLIAGLLERGVKNRTDMAEITADSLENLLIRCCRAAAITCRRQGADLPRTGEIG